MVVLQLSSGDALDLAVDPKNSVAEVQSMVASHLNCCDPVLITLISSDGQTLLPEDRLEVYGDVVQVLVQPLLFAPCIVHLDDGSNSGCAGGGAGRPAVCAAALPPPDKTKEWEFVSGHTDGNILLWQDAECGKVATFPDKRECAVTALACGWAPETDYILSGYADGRIRKWELTFDETVAEMNTETTFGPSNDEVAEIVKIVFSQDYRQVFVLNGEGYVVLYNTLLDYKYRYIHSSYFTEVYYRRFHPEADEKAVRCPFVMGLERRRGSSAVFRFAPGNPDVYKQCLTQFEDETPIQGLAVTDDATFYATVCDRLGGGSVVEIIREVEEGSDVVENSIEFPESVIDFAFSGNLLVVATAAEVQVWSGPGECIADVKHGLLPKAVPTGELRRASSLFISQDFVIFTCSGSICVFRFAPVAARVHKPEVDAS
eukprot:TRINITY_DN41611_c0_g1_i1.p1 TRINITY_DN41611_c0_g1~~TRINITY_DN41611_c0_g1_i1.p1  ORF type:complete len:431 (+),score=55.75 TRINITY_DN41611_c0_g1_i1:62-1354(+)